VKPGKRLLFVRTSSMGDVLHALPAATALRELHPDWHIGWAIEPHWSPLLRARAGTQAVVDRIHLVPARLWKQHPFSLETLRSILQLRRELRGRTTTTLSMCRAHSVPRWWDGSRELRILPAHSHRVSFQQKSSIAEKSAPNSTTWSNKPPKF